jgi:hypothetical protein
MAHISVGRLDCAFLLSLARRTAATAGGQEEDRQKGKAGDQAFAGRNRQLLSPQGEVLMVSLNLPGIPPGGNLYSRLRVCMPPVFQDLVPCEMPVTARFLGRPRLLTRLTSRVFKQVG